MAENILKWGICLIIFSLPAHLVRFEIFGIPTTVLEIMIYVLFLIWLIRGSDFSGAIKIFKENRLLFWAVFLILFGAVLATLNSWDLRLSLGILKAWFIDPLMFFVVFISVIKTEKEVKGVFYAFIFSGLVVSLVSLIYLFYGKLNIDGRLQGFYNSPNYLAMYIAPALVVGLGLFFCPDLKNLRPMLIILCSAFLILILFCTGSFGAWMGIFGAIGLGAVVWLIKLKKGKLALFLCVLFIVLCVGLYFIKFSSVQGRLSINSRLEIWQRAVSGALIYLPVGIGPGTFKDLFPENPSWSVPQPHNLYLAFLLQTGIIGFVGFVLLLVWFYWPKVNQLWADVQLLLIMIMMYILIHGLVDTTYWKNDMAVTFWTIIGTMAILKISKS